MVYKVDIDRPSTWTKYQNGMCNTCYANCCTMPVEVKISDLIRLNFITEFESQEPAKNIYKNLKKRQLVEHFNLKQEMFTLTRKANGECFLLDSKTRRCTVYENRPNTCREHPQVSSRPGYCPYQKIVINPS